MEALKMMGPPKSLGSHGYGACFYQSYWGNVGDNVCEAVLHFLNGGSRAENRPIWLICMF